ncbi:acetyltransferase [Guyparkeria halophila]|uniref:Acetyltransferase n=1 Tax=Guyparkeria halophila TaxID=47960 RepID=A0ABZ0Z1W2_9GAMM|nr:acetyltransferase [Guyparkeria halophila]WQH17381.1 acetyltransferase [Guyparkeria halophila]
MRLAILGASGHGKVVADTARAAGWSDVTFFDDAWVGKRFVTHHPIVGDAAALFRSVAEFDGVIVAIGNNRVRLDKTRALFDAGAKLVSVVHPASVVSELSAIQEGSVVMAGAVVQADARLGIACIVNTNASVDHDCELADGVHICPGVAISGDVVGGECAWFGVGASVRQGLRIGADAVIGAGAAVVKDVEAGTTVVGVPARPAS